MKEKTAEADQIAALPLHRDKTGKLRVLMVTSRDTGRWVMPKGWLMDGKKPWQAAEIEALEEAGAVGFVGTQPIGTYCYKKRLGSARKINCKVTVYPMIVEKLHKRWKERKERKRHWFSVAKAAKLVDEKELSDILKSIARQPDEIAVVDTIRKAS